MIGWGILGCGDITNQRGAPAINALEGSRLISFQSRTASLAEAFAQRHGALRSTSNRAQLLADPEITAVYVATEHHRHLEDVLAAAQAGKHVLCEKPMANSVDDCRRMIAACRDHGVSLQIAYYRRYYPKLIRLRELLQAGVIGQPVSVQIHCTQRLEPARLTPDNWRLRKELSGGGALVDTGSHRLDLLCWLLGEPVLVAALAERQELPIQTTDSETLLIRMLNGVHAASFHGYRTPSEDRFEITGTEGVLSATSVDGPNLRLTTAVRAECWELPRHANVHYPLFEDFARRLAEGAPPQYPGEDGMQASRIIEAAYASARSGRFHPA
ncbi:MAG: Gfo/Idh/MocA family protein [Actinomycetota bacterium]